MSSNNQYPSNYFIVSTDIVLTDFNGKLYPLTGANANAQVLGLKIYESLESPYLMAELFILDNAINLIGRVPITGAEKITFGVKTPYFSDKEYKYEFRISAVRNRSGLAKHQKYVLDLISYEGLQNEGLRVGKPYADYAHNIVSNIMKDYFRTSKNVDVSDNCKYPIKMVPRNQRPFELIYSLLTTSIPATANTTSYLAKSSSLSKNVDSSIIVGKTDACPSELISGSAGYFFWETYDGFKFISLDTLCDPSTTTKDQFAYKPANTDYNKDPGRSIIEYSYINEIDVMKKMRYGTYNSMVIFFNPSTSNYEEYSYDITTSYPTMKHLGKDETIPEGPLALSKYPTRIISQIHNSETFYNGTGIASIYPSENSTGNGAAFPDYKKFYLAQSIARELLLENQKLHVTINGNLNLRAGDKINILLPNYSAQSLRTPSEQYDLQNSGLYLIKDITYEFHILKNEQYNVAVTNMVLIRDSFGSFTLNVQ
jgi:hypothetical protein